MAKKKENKWLQVGNFLLGVDKNAHGQYVVLKSIADNWRIVWRDDTLMFAMMLQVMRRAADDNNIKEYLHSLCAIMFAATTYMHDLIALGTKQQMPVCEGFAKLLAEQAEYEGSLEKKPSDKEDEEALKEVGEMQEIQNELEKLDEGGNGAD